MRKSLWTYLVIQLTLLTVWCTGVTDWSVTSLVLMTIPTWLPYIIILPLKMVEKRLKRKINKRIKKNGHD